MSILTMTTDELLQSTHKILSKCIDMFTDGYDVTQEHTQGPLRSEGKIPSSRL